MGLGDRGLLGLWLCLMHAEVLWMGRKDGKLYEAYAGVGIMAVV